MVESIDEELMVGMMAGEQEALAVLVSRHHAPLLGYLFRLAGGDRHLAEDLLQETFVRVLRQRTYQPGRPFKPWLYTIATNLARDHFKSVAVRQRLARGEDALRDLNDSAPGPEGHAVATEQGREVRMALARLGDEYRVALVLRFYQGFSLREIAETLEIPLGTVKSRLSVGTRRLRRALDPQRKDVE